MDELVFVATLRGEVETRGQDKITKICMSVWHPMWKLIG